MEADIPLPLAGIAGSRAPSSVISPLSLPGAVQYFDPKSRPPLPNHPNTLAGLVWSSTNTRGNNDPPRAQPACFLSPHLTPIPSHAQYQLQFQRHTQQRASSLSPTRLPPHRRRRGPTEKRDDTGIDVSSRFTSSAVSAPVDTISGTGSGLITVRRPAMRTTHSLDSVVSGESQLSAEQDFCRRERKLMQAFSDERRRWQESHNKTEGLYQDIMDQMEAALAEKTAQWESERYELQMQITELQHRLEEAESRNRASSDQRLPTFQPGPPSQINPTRLPGLATSESRDSTSIDSSLANMDAERPSKVIDVQEYHKDLEGIHLKESFVKMETFTDKRTGSVSKSSSKASSPSRSPPEDTKALARARSMRALKADASSRLTMNAGHTPTVSLSIAHTGTSNTVVSSGSNTPTLMSGDGAMSSDGNENKNESSEPAEPVSTAVVGDQALAILEPSDEDQELTGPLTLRNMPAKDEFFLRRLSDKLEKAASGEDATPAVLKNSDDEDDGDEANTELASGDSNAADSEDVEEDIPLKFKSTSSNFGKPFGVA